MSSESEMVERIRAAMIKADEEMADPVGPSYEVLARIAIEAIREYGHEVGTRRMWQELFPPPPEMSGK